MYNNNINKNTSDSLFRQEENERQC